MRSLEPLARVPSLVSVSARLSAKQPLFFLCPLTFTVPLCGRTAVVPPAFMRFILVLQRARAVSRHSAAHVHRVSTTSGRTRAFPAPGTDSVLDGLPRLLARFVPLAVIAGCLSPRKYVVATFPTLQSANELKDAGRRLPAPAFDTGGPVLRPSFNFFTLKLHYIEERNKGVLSRIFCTPISSVPLIFIKGESVTE